MRAIFYIDGFNFYFLRQKFQPQYKWLNPKALADLIVPTGTTVSAVKYYTADVSGKLDADAPKRQQALLAAFKTVPEIEIYKGRFLSSQKWSKLVQPPQAKPDTYVWNVPHPILAYVHKTEEKGSDVNLGAHLVRDAFTDTFDIAYILTNDTDLVEPIRIVSEEVGKQVCIVAPCRPRHGSKIPIPSPSLANVSHFVHYIDDTELAASLFPPILNRLGKKPIVRPATWV
jgi:hypothetical protein